MTAPAPHPAGPRVRPDWRAHPHVMARLCWCGHRPGAHARPTAGAATTGSCDTCPCPAYVKGIQP